MKFNLFILIFFINLFYSQQDFAFVYRLEARTNLATERKVIEDFYLITEKENQSFFIGEKLIKIDSIKKSLLPKDGSATSLGFVNIADIPKTNFNFIVGKNMVNNKVWFYDKLLKHRFVYEEQPVFNWSVQDETVKIGDFNCTKAIMNYYGRDWIAWFTTDIPLNNGPYKFSGLPGLIVKINDTQNHFKFELIGIKKSTNNGDFADDKNLAGYKKISKADYLKAVRNINENILQEVENIGISISKEDQENLKNRTKIPRNRLELIP